MLSRWISALGGLAILFGTLHLFGPAGLTVICSVIVMVAAYEYSLLFEKTSLWLLIFMAFNASIFATQLLAPSSTLAVLAASFVGLTSVGIFCFRNQEPKHILGKVQWTLWGLIYTGLFPALGVGLLYNQGASILIYLLVTVLVGDTVAFFTGRLLGGPKIFPNISPKKTISGAAGGLVGSAISGSVFLYYQSSLRNWLLMLAVSTAIGAFAQFGDFFESLIKRVSGKKDSSQLMPGHGGLLDRLDGVYFGSAIMYFFCVVMDFNVYF